MSIGGGNNNGNANGGAGLGFGMNNSNNNSQMHGNMANGLQSQETGNSQPNSEYTLAGILHHLQGEWRRYEKDRNEWEIERAEMRARIALLEGERRGVENLKTDLMRRVKMLEYALRQERSKYLSFSANNAQSTSSLLSSTAPQVKNPLLQSLEKGTTSSGRSSPAPFAESAPTASAITATGGVNAGALAAGLLSRSTSSAKDPKSRAKSREYLKQCLQEISYLTSASTLNPLPDRGIASGSLPNGANVQSALRPRKTMPESVPPTLSAPTTESHAAMAGSISRASATTALGVPNAKAGRPGRSPLFASEPALEEANETEEASSNDDFSSAHGQRDQEVSAPQQQQSSGAADNVPLKNPLSATFVEPEASASLSASNDSADEREQDEAPSSSSSSDSSRSSQSSDSLSTSAGSLTDQELDEQEQVTAIFKPGGRDWQKLKEAGIKSRERRDSERQSQTAAEEASIISEAQQQLAITSEKVNQLMNRSGGRTPGSERKDEEDLANISLATEDDEAAKEAADAAADSLLWKSKKVLRSHLDAVRAVAFLQNEMTLLSASDDNTIKFWNLDVGTLNQPAAKSGTDSQPLVTFRGHFAAVTCLAVSPNKRRFYSGSLDSSIRVWQLPDPAVEAYPPFEKSMELGCLVGHSQAVWDVALLPDRSDEEGRLASASADGTVKIWSVRSGGSSSAATSNGEANSSAAPAVLQLSWDYFGSDPSPSTAKERENLEKSGTLPVPTCVEACHSDLRLVAVSYSNSVVKLFDLDTGRQVRQLKSDETYDGSVDTQINKLVTHPTLPLLITAHEDGYIRMFDLDTGSCTLSMTAHLDAVTSLDIDASGLTLVSGGHDCSVRFWDIAGGSLMGKDGPVGGEGDKSTAVCRQEISSHRNKASEGVLAVKYHPTAPYFASAGADGVIRIYG
ncbi:related to STRIATIN [Sporisorium scitamineum]|uniref:Related to STRIATIN n=1 Tax=Sporisorium scitamineum TaxID=49012 RepID=A0A0F7S9U1_9BASI|nr:related to STRIATIN [Sporisorium scitamineum]CDW99001.1 hypothetical protein [Sporisorium scitamineum]